jgi:mono/diheme cytochrome c family protein
VFEGNGIYGFFALETSREVAVVNAHGKAELFRIPTGRTPQGVAVSPDGLKLFVYNFMDRSVGIYDLTDLKINGQYNVPLLAMVPTVGTETLSPQVLLGKQLFYDAWDDRLARDKYLSCAACHNEGGQDGRVWDLTGMGEGLRNTINLAGTGAADGRLHWSQNFDEVQDFEGQIRLLSEGTGLMADEDFDAGTTSEPLGDPKAGLSADLDALAAYVASLNAFANSPQRNADSSLTADAIVGRAIFQRENCAACHTGTKFTDSDTDILHDIGTLKPSSGTRLGGPEPLPGIDTPTLRSVWNTAPYLHDGSAETLAEAVVAHDTVSLNATDMSSLVAYLGQIDANEVSAPLPNSIVEHTAAAEITTYGAVTGSYADTASDDGIAEHIAETHSGGKKSNRHTRLEHRWQFNIGSGNSTLLIANVWKSGSAEDDFSFEYSTDASSYSSLFVVSSTDAANVQVVLLPGGISGTVYVRVVDTDRNPGNRSIEELHVDHLYIRVESASVGTPPVAPANLSAVAVSASQVNLTWTDLSDDEFGFDIERSTNGGSSWQSIATAPANSTAYSDTTVIGDVFYDYRINAANGAGSSAWDGPITVQTPVGVGVVLAADGYKVKGTKYVELSWTGGPVQSWDIYRQGTVIAIVSSGASGNYTDNIGTKGGGSYTYVMCEAGGTTSCSNEVTFVF